MPGTDQQLPTQRKRGANSDTEGGSQVVKKMKNTCGKRSNVHVPQAWAKHNLLYQGFPMGELEADRPKGARCLSWAVHYAEKQSDPSYIYFFAHEERYGGPYGFLSNFFEVDFQDSDLIEGHTFTSVEQYYQYRKCVFLADAPERFSGTISSKQLKDEILRGGRSPNQTATLGRTFSSFRDSPNEQDRAWFDEWNAAWVSTIPQVLMKTLRLKFEQNADLTERLLMTGDFVLAEASGSDSSCGIGGRAREAIAQPGRWKGQNLPGKCLMDIRAELRTKHPHLPHYYAYVYWRAYEDFLAQSRSESLSKAGVKQHRTRLQELQQAWSKGPQSVEQYTTVPQFP